uniref:WASH complex subunit 7 n=3 Tax=Anthurium amnicola TaxID=1678845 RepID=A0A1D1XXL3_9ARAE
MVSTASKNVVCFLTQKMSTLSGLLQDDILRSLLVKERMWKNEKGTPNKYPFKRAEHLSATMAKYSFRGHEVNIVDQLRSIITEMGNGLGLVRLLHTGGSRQACRISSCKPRYVTNFLESDRSCSPSDEIDTPGKVMDDAVYNKCQSIYGVDYFPSLLSSVLKELQCDRYLNLIDFHFIIPAIIANLIESKLHSKEKPLRRDREAGNQMIADDGFVMGATFVLKVTGQEKSFDELQWFTSANRHLEEVLISLSHITEHPKGSRIFGLKLWDQSCPVAILPETQKEIDKTKRYQKEMKLIEYGFNASRAIMS